MGMKTRKIKQGEKITEPGVYLMPLGWYHDDCCDGPSISSGGLRTIDLRTPAHYWADSYLNPDRIETDDEPEKLHFRQGRAAHWLLIEPEEFQKRVVMRPAIWKDWRTNDAKAWRANAQLEGKTVLSPEEMAQVVGMAQAMKAHSLHRDGIMGGDIEHSMIIRDPKTGVWLKSRPDAMPAAAAMLTDYKGCTDASPRAVARAIKTLGYDMQLALAGICYASLFGVEIDDYVIVAQEWAAPHVVHVKPISSEMIFWARIRLRAAINTFAECLKTKYWPGYDAEDGREAILEKYEVENFEARQLKGLLPKEF